MKTDRTALALIDEAVQLLRASPPTVYALYCAGTVPFVLVLFSFCAEMSYDRNASDNCAASAVALALTYCWMKGLQAFCCRELVRVYTGNINQMVETNHDAGYLGRQIAFQPLGFFIKPLAWLLVFPVTYVSAFFQNLTILGGVERNDLKKSWKLARLWPKQSYAVYGLLSLLALIVFFDLYAIIFSIPFALEGVARYREFSDTKLYLGLLPGPLDRRGCSHLFFDRSPGQSNRGDPLLRRRIPGDGRGFAAQASRFAKPRRSTRAP